MNFSNSQVSAVRPVHSYEARFSSDRSERFRQCWEISGEKCKEITGGPERLNEGRAPAPGEEEQEEPTDDRVRATRIR